MVETRGSESLVAPVLINGVIEPQFHAMSHSACSCLQNPLVLAAARKYVQCGISRPRHWLADSCCGIDMTWDESDFIPGTLKPFTGGSAKIGSGDLCPATHKGQLRSLYARAHGTGKLVKIPDRPLAWLVPSIVFKILSTGHLEDVGVQMTTGGPDRACPNYLQFNARGTKIKLKKHNSIYVLPTVDMHHLTVSDVSNIQRAPTHKYVSHRRQHSDIPLWFVLGADTSSSACAEMVSIHMCAKGSVLGNALAGCDTGGTSVALILNPSQVYELTIPYCGPPSFTEEEVQCALTACSLARQVPASVYCSPGAPAAEILVHIPSYATAASRPPLPCCSMSPVSSAASCGSGLCENRNCVEYVAGVHHGSVNRTSPYFKAKSNLLLQHARLGDMGERLLYDACRRGRIRGISLTSPTLPCNCRVCNLCKNKRSNFKSVEKSPAQIAYEDGLETCTMDFVGPMRTKSIGGCIGAHIAVYLGCRTQSSKQPVRFIKAYPVRTRSQASLCVEDFTCLLKARYNITVRHWHFDNAKEYDCGGIHALQRAYSFYSSYSPAYTPIRNREAESGVKVISQITLCLLTRGRAPSWAWSLAMKYAAHIWNAVAPVNGYSPHELISGYVPDVSMFRVFWCDCFPAYLPEEGRGKFDLKSRGSLDKPCKFVGFDDTHPDVWSYWDPIRRRVDMSPHMRFDESAFDGSRELWEDSFSSPFTPEQVSDLASDLSGDFAAVPDCAPDGGDDSDDNDGDDSKPVVNNHNHNNLFPQLSYGSGASQPPTPQMGERSGTNPNVPDQHVSEQSHGSLHDIEEEPEIESPDSGSGQLTRPQRERRPPQRFIAESATEHNSRMKDGCAQTALSDAPSQPEAVAQSRIEYVPTDNPLDGLVPREVTEERINAVFEFIQNRTALEKAHEFVDSLVHDVNCIAASYNDITNCKGRLPDPNSYAEARKTPDWPRFEEAINDEMASLMENKTGTVVKEKDVPPGKNIMKSKGVFTRKYNEHGDIARWKYRLVGCGYSQIEGLDYFDTHAGTVSIVVIRILFALIAALHLHTRLFDIGTAFLEGELNEEVYIRLPPYLGGDIWRLHKALYGLKQAGHVFVKLMNTFLRSLGFQQSKTEPQLFVLITRPDDRGRMEGKKSDIPPQWNGYGYIVVTTYIDDLPAASNSVILLDWFERELKERFKKVSVSVLRWFLGMRCVIEPGRVSVDQGQYTACLIKKFESYLRTYCATSNGNIRWAKTPADPDVVLSKTQSPQTPGEAAAVADLPYRELVGGLLYLANNTRVDIQVRTSECARFMSNYGMAHWLAALRILCYLGVFPDRPVVWNDQGPENNLRVIYETDASFGNCPDTGRSRYGILGFLSGAFIDSKTGILKNVRTNTMDAETGALAQCTLRVLTTRRYMADLGFPQTKPTPIAEDNNAALIFSKSPVATRRSRHIHVDHHLTRENQMEFRTIAVYKEDGANLRADMQTKNLGRVLLNKHSERTMGSPAFLGPSE